MKKGFTLIEILIVVGVVLLIMISMSGIMLGIFNSQSKNKATDKIDQNGSWILDELKKNILNADNGSNSENGGKFTCPVDVYGDSIITTSVKDGNKTTLSCFFDNLSESYKIASISATAEGTTMTTYLFQKNNDLVLSGCSNFVTCSTLPDLRLSNVRFSFDLEAGIAGLSSGTTKTFSVDVTLRN